MSSQHNDSQTFTENLPEPNIVPLNRNPLDDEPPLPAHILNKHHQDVSAEVGLEWEPLHMWESIEGVLVRRTAMSLGGTAYVFDMRSPGKIDAPDSRPRLVLLKKGGRILDSFMQHIEIGGRIYIRYRGELEAKPGQNPARDWRVVRINPSKLQKT